MAVRDGTAANDGYLREKSHGGAAEEQDGGRPAKQGDFCVESAEKKEKMDPQAA